MTLLEMTWHPSTENGAKVCTTKKERNSTSSSICYSSINRSTNRTLHFISTDSLINWHVVSGPSSYITYIISLHTYNTPRFIRIINVHQQQGIELIKQAVVSSTEATVAAVVVVL